MHGMHRRNLSGMSQRQLSDVSETHEQASPPTSQTAQDTHYTPGPSYMRGQAQSHAEDASPARAFRGAAGVSFHSPFSAKLALLDNEENEAGVAGAPSLFLPGYPTVHGLPPHPQLSPLRPQLAQPEKAQDTEAGSALAPNLGSLPAPPLNNVFTGSLLVAGGGDAGAQHASLGSSVGALQSLGQVSCGSYQWQSHLNNLRALHCCRAPALAIYRNTSVAAAPLSHICALAKHLPVPYQMPKLVFGSLNV